ncbi:carbon monoxide dehydrogenase subunit G [Geodermatophilus bullaregiensis]|uniref:SRPBCC family protein n=1 Tax=Geodermatophilus bullaregiensis TaxID=1564160 RepID=UPI00195D1F02|nr:SRPBCC family protein [Geodermatophilus bullaregiensis]MBM7806416.1 carbon monoxide dehydrogenase subunit G [Geodermatophilus bullaregiensis]
MQLENSFTVPVPVDEAWRVLLDIERIAPCMPGAALDSVEGDSFTGRVKVKLGPINLTYQGKASFVEKDEAAHRAVIDGRGKDQRGNGTAAALITAQLKGEGDTTRVDVLTDLNITGRPAQFGRGVMTDVGNKLLGQFADKLAAQLGEGDAQGDAARADAARADAPGSVTATATGVAEEVAASVEQTPGDNAAAEAVRRAGTAAREAAASATDEATGKTAAAAAGPTDTVSIAAVGATDTAPVPAVGDAAQAAAGTAPAASDTTPVTPVGGAPSTPPSGPSAPPTRPATGAPPRSTPRPVQQPAEEPEPIDLLEVAGGAAMARFAAPAAGLAALLLLITLVVRRRRR